MLAVLATTGVLRGLQDTVTPLVVAVIGAVLNVGLNLLLVLGFGLGVAGSAIGTAITQTAMARGARRWSWCAPPGRTAPACGPTTT